MGITVRLQNENNKSVSEFDIGIDFYIPSEDSSYRLLCYIDPYGNTIFNQLQMSTFLFEWENIKNNAKTPDEITAWLKIKQLAERCKKGPHLYLCFIGD